MAISVSIFLLLIFNKKFFPSEKIESMVAEHVSESASIEEKENRKLIWFGNKYTRPLSAS